jgi:hypothetical protein
MLLLFGKTVRTKQHALRILVSTTTEACRMPGPRSRLVDPFVTPWYHCISRCVRRAFLCGEGAGHRKQWIEDRLKELVEIFAVECAGFYLIDNRLHLRLRLCPRRASGWSVEAAARGAAGLLAWPMRTPKSAQCSVKNESGSGSLPERLGPAPLFQPFAVAFVVRSQAVARLVPLHFALLPSGRSRPPSCRAGISLYSHVGASPVLD